MPKDAIKKYFSNGSVFLLEYIQYNNIILPNTLKILTML